MYSPLTNHNSDENTSTHVLLGVKKCHYIVKVTVKTMNHIANATDETDSLYIKGRRFKKVKHI